MLMGRWKNTLAAAIVVGSLFGSSIGYADDGAGYETVVSESGPTGDSAGHVLDVTGQGPTVADVVGSLPAAWVHRSVRGERLVTLSGFDQHRILVTVQGVPLRVPYDGIADLGRFPSGLVARVRVYEGPRGLEVGPSGMGGVLAFDLQSGTRAPRLGLQAGFSALGWDLSILSGGSTPTLSWTMGGQVTSVDAFRLSRSFRPTKYEDGGLRENSDKRMGALGFNIEWRPDMHHSISFFSLGTLGSLGVPPSTKGPLVRYWRWSDDRLGLAGLVHGWKQGDFSMRTGLYAIGYGNTVDAFDDATYLLRRTDRAYHSTFRDSSLGGFTTASYRFSCRRIKDLVTRLWLDFRHDRHHQVLDGTVGPTVGSSEVRFAAETDVGVTSRQRVMAQLEIRGQVPGPSPPLTDWEGGAGSDDHGSSSWAVGPLVAYRARFGLFELDARVGRRERFATLKERFSDGLGRRAANPDLRPESAWTARVTGKAPLFGMLVARASVFGSLLDDLMEQRPFGAGLVQIQNVGRALLAGSEESLAFVWSTVTLSVGHMFLYGRLLTGNAGLDGVPGHRASLRLRLGPWHRVEGRIAVAVTGPFVTLDPDSGLRRRVDGSVLVDAAVQVEALDGLFVFVRAGNLLDWNYETAPGQPGPGFSLWGGIRLFLR